MKVKSVVDREGRFVGYSFFCPGCRQRHTVPLSPVPDGEVESPYNAGQAHWYFSGTLEEPTFSPSIHIRTGHYAQPVHKTCWCTGEMECPQPRECFVCHSFVRDGMIEYLNDCTHALAGQRVPLPDVDQA